MSKATAPVYQIKVSLKDSDPLIWRQLLVSSETKLSQFHRILQAAMGWKDAHLHGFRMGPVNFSYPHQPGDLEEMTAVDERYVKLSHLVPAQRPFRGEFRFEMAYTYDFGDTWEHEIIFEDVLPRDAKWKIPLCLAGENACPPEDVGGIGGYANFLAAMSDPEHPEHEDYSAWVDGAFDPKKIDLIFINRYLRAIF